jgi:hypothetical protein
VSERDDLFGREWVHVFEEDGPEGGVFRPEGGDLPLSRRPRQRLSFSPDGSAWLVVAGPDDRLEQVKGRWREEKGEITVTTESAAASLRVLHIQVRSSGCLLVRR